MPTHARAIARSCRARRALAVVVGLCAALAGCRKAPLGTGPAGDAGYKNATTDVARPLVYDGPLDARVVARMFASRPHLVQLSEGTLLLDTGLFVHEITPSGGLRLVGEPAAYAALQSAGDENLGGYDVPGTAYNRKLTGARTSDLFLRAQSPEAEGPSTFTWNGKVWTAAADGDVEKPEAEPTLDAPEGITRVDWTPAADGRRIGIGRREGREPPVTFILKAEERTARRVPLDLAKAAGEGQSLLCEHVPSKGAPHVMCSLYANPTRHWVYRFDGDSWTLVTGGGLSADDAPANVDAPAVGHDDALWFAALGNVTRITRDGRVTTFEIPTAGTALARARYWSDAELVQTAGDDGALKRWEQLDVIPEAAPERVVRVDQIVPVRDGEAWLIATERTGAHVAVHLRKPSGDIGALPEAIAIGSETDQRAAIHNASAPRTWVGRCPQLFVTLARQRLDGAFAPESVWSRESEISQTANGLTRRGEQGPRVALVEGALAGRKAAGVLVWRAHPDSREDLLDAVTLAIAKRFAESPATPAAITCTAPVLARAKVL